MLPTVLRCWCYSYFVRLCVFYYEAFYVESASLFVLMFMSHGAYVGSNGSGDHCVYALARQRAGNLAQVVISSTQDPS